LSALLRFPAHGIEADAGKRQQRMAVLVEDVRDCDMGAVVLTAEQPVAAGEERRRQQGERRCRWWR